LSSRQPTTQAGIERIKELGLGCMEIEFVQGVRMGPEMARQVGEFASRLGVSLSAHAPYFVNLNAREPDKIAASQQRLLQTARIGALCGARSVVFHAAFYLDDPPGQVYDTVKKHLQAVVEQLRGEGVNIRLRPETTGKPTQFGSLEEVLNLCLEIPELAPTIDFAHWHARTGSYNSYAEFNAILDQIENKLGRGALDDIHIHLSGITYTKKGESKHLRLQDCDLRYPELLRALKERGVQGLVVCESPNLEEDALLLQETYNSLP